MQYTIEAFCKDCKILADRVNDYPFTHILSVERGGGYVTRELIKYFPRAIVVPIKVSFYKGDIKQEQPHIEYPACKVFNASERVLICDDLLDSGDTISYIQNMHILKKAGSVKTAVVLVKPTSKIQADYYVHNNITSWVQFYWEDSHGNHIVDSGVSHTTLQAAV
jgi:hypoxanthine phosphoribosyltransferase